MTRRSVLRGTVLAVVAVLLVAPTVLADTCCANIRVGLDPGFAKRGDIIQLTGLLCLNPDNTGPLQLNLGAFWLSPGRRPAENDPGSVPGLGLPAPDLPPVESWFSFRSVPSPQDPSGDVTIVVPDLPNGTYQLWWWCDNGSGPGGGIHYSNGPRLAIGAAPDTATSSVTEAPNQPGTSGLPIGEAMALGTAVFAGFLRWGPFGARRRPRGS